MKVYINPSKPCGTVLLPSSKSETHRAFICAALSGGSVKNPLFCDDTVLTLDGLKKLGVGFKVTENEVSFKKLSINDITDTEIFCKNSGSTLRFLIPFAFMCGKKITFKGDSSLFSRPLDAYEKICSDNKIEFVKGQNFLTVCGKLKQKTVFVSSDKSSQFLSGLLMAAPILDVEIFPSSEIKSEPYVRLTAEVLKNFGVEVAFAEKITASGEYKAAEYTVNADATAAAYIEAFSFLGKTVSVSGIKDGNKQGDTVYKEIFEKLRSGESKFDLENCIDLAPVLFAVAALKGGKYRFCGVNRLRYKESDRLVAMSEILNGFGVKCEQKEDTVLLWSNGLKKPQNTLPSYSDHRIVFAETLLLSKTGGAIDGAEAVRKSYPEFFDSLKKIGLLCSEI